MKEETKLMLLKFTRVVNVTSVRCVEHVAAIAFLDLAVSDYSLRRSSVIL